MSKLDQKTPTLVEITRRNFLSGSVATGLSLAAMASLVKAAPAQAQAAAPIPPAQRARTLSVERGNCTGCCSCVTACSLFHDNVVRPATARIYVQRFYGLVDVPMMCWHCPDAPCVEACPVTPQKAIAKDKETNIISYVDENLCLGASCNRCIQACPSQYLRRHPETARPIFCDLCDGDPQCVKACARQALESGETLRCDTQHAGIHYSYRDVTPGEAADGLMQRLFYPNKFGERPESV